MTIGSCGRLTAALVLAWVTGVSDAGAQARRPVAIEATAGWAGFVDDATIEHTVWGIGARVPLGSRLSVGPEVLYMIGPGSDRDVFVLGSLWVDLGPQPEAARVVPYLVVGGGYEWHSDRFATGRYVSGEGAFTAGGGARVHLNDRIYLGGEARIGWELHLQATAHVGVTWPRR